MPTDARNLPQTLLRVAWMSILLGLGIEIALIITSLVLGKYGGLPPMLADLVNKVSWSVFVCVGVAAGTAAGKARPAAMGILGALAAPAAFIAAKAAQKGVAQALGMAAAPPSAPSAIEMCLIRAVEYAILGAVVGWMSRQPWTNLVAHLAAGFALGVVFGGLVLWLSARGGAAMPTLISKGVNELIFPIGCSLVLFISNAIGKRMAQPTPA